MADPIDDAKRALRAELRERRQLLTEAARRAAAEGITAQAGRAGGILRRPVGLVLSVHRDRAGNARVRQRGRGPRHPRPAADHPRGRTPGLDRGRPGRRRRRGLLGLPEPVGELLGPIAVNDVDLMIIPAASVDRSGMRLGWGRGYFDKTLGSIQNCPPVYAVVYDSELVDEVPRDLHDQPVTGVVTPTRTVVLAPAGR
ncbi:5-formyltetrahydrofolate cyclo-ligase [Microbacterium elymi]|uniref:5-formyltetrahydrofolate cyclo-ligase n=1 Tax=Microbacterium elymi TaxID=2909587 RepID=A0ABY3SUW5_9MICO|nr:5-formyltetrahydrofolate cyclo-ligase [Microbacterium elymi]UJP13110.2 5-formyltetrahydrofolate cyclo-ligase [Microbacterium elymi]